MSNPLISSFVLRAFLVEQDPESGICQWRIKVTNVQTNEAVTVRTMEEAALYMNETLERGFVS